VSRDGTRIAFAGQANLGCGYNQNDNQIFLLNLETLQIPRFDSQQGRTPDWSPDDAYLVYETTRYCPTSGRYAIIVQDVSSRRAVQATACEYDANHAVWSPDGSSIAFSALLPGGQSRGIAIIPVPDLGVFRSQRISGVMHGFGCDGEVSGTRTVTLQPGGRTASTVEGGFFAFDDVQPGEYLLQFGEACGSIPCYSDRVVQVADADVFVDVCFELCPAPRLDPPSGPPGTSVGLVGRCYYIHSGQTASVLFDGEAVGVTSHGDTSGNYTAQFEVPAGAAPGEHPVTLDKSLGAPPAIFVVTE
jgi:hypothetical protein